MLSGRDEAFVADENYGMEKYTFADRVKKRLSDLGIGCYQRPTLERDHEAIFQHLKAGQYFDGRLPTVIRKLTLDQLSSLYALYSNWFGYITTQFMLVSAERSEAMRKRDFLLGHIRNYYRVPDEEGKKPPEAAISDAAKQDIRFIEANALYEELNCLYDEMDAMRRIADQDMKVVSRQVTIQQEKNHRELLLQGFGSRGRNSDFADAFEGSNYGLVPENPPESKEGDAEGPPRARPRPRPQGPHILRR